MVRAPTADPTVALFGRSSKKGRPRSEPERRVCEMMAEQPKAQGASAGGKKDGPRGSYTDPRDDKPTLSEAGPPQSEPTSLSASIAELSGSNGAR